MRAQFVFHEVWIGLRRNLTMTIALVVVVAISLSLLGTGLLFVQQVNNTRSYWQGKVQLSVYLCSTTSDSPQCTKNGPATTSEIAQIKRELTGDNLVKTVAFVSQSQAYAQFRQEFANNPSLVKATPPGWIPSSFEIRLKNTEADASQVAAVIDGAPGVDQVIEDSSVLDKFYKLLDGARNAVVVIAIILIIAAILLVANTIRLSAFNRRRETSIMRLVGASNFYVQLPVPGRGHDRRPAGLADLRRAADRGEVLVAERPPAVFSGHRAAQHQQPGRGDPPGDDHRTGALRHHVVPHPQALLARLSP